MATTAARDAATPQTSLAISASGAGGPVRRSAWILGPWADLLCFVATPFLIWPLIAVVQNWLSAGQIWQLVIAFASVGHHLPGFLRAYFDPELFARFRTRLLVVPPLVFATCWAFEWQHLLGLKVLIVLWATWHGLMQTYGFLRIYEAKRGGTDPWSAWLDYALCLAMFSAGTVASESRSYDLLRRLWSSGGPVFDPALWPHVQMTVLAATAVVVLVYLARVVGTARQGINVLKLTLAGGTAWIWWLCGARGTDPLLGVAMFEIYHAVQYLAIVWVANRGWTARLTAGESWTARRLRSPGLRLALYLGLIALYGGLYYGFVTGGAASWWPQRETALAGTDADGSFWAHVAQVFPLALLGTSTLLHYYFDGFIWKVRERSTQADLGLVSDRGPASERSLASQRGPAPQTVPALLHGSKWALFFVPALWLGAAELHQRSLSTEAQAARARAIAMNLTSATPDSAEAWLLQAKTALAQHDLRLAETACQRALALRPGWAEAHAVCGNVAQEAGDWARAAEEYRAAWQREPSQRAYAFNLAGARAAQQHFAEAEKIYRNLLSHEFMTAEVRAALATLHGAWGIQLLAQHEPRSAREKFDQALAARPDWAEIHFQAGVAHQLLHEPRSALRHYQQCLAREPRHAGAALNLGAAWQALGDTPQAAGAYRAVLAQDPRSGPAHFNLGLLLWDDVRPHLADLKKNVPENDEKMAGRRATLRAAHQHLATALELGQPVPPALWQAVGQAILETD